MFACLCWLFCCFVYFGWFVIWWTRFSWLYYCVIVYFVWGGDLDASGGVLWRLCSVVVICVVYLDFVVVWMGVLLIVLFLTFIWYAYGYWFGGLFIALYVLFVCRLL